MKRPTKVKLEIVKTIPAGLIFQDEVFGKGSVYVARMSEALAASGAVLIAVGDAYMKQQLKMAAKKLKVKLVYAISGDTLYVKPIAIDGEQRRLLLLLREPRSVAELESKKLELHLLNTLSALSKDGIAHVVKDKWVLTEKGLDTL